MLSECSLAICANIVRFMQNFLSNVSSFLRKRTGFIFCPSFAFCRDQEHSKHGFKPKYKKHISRKTCGKKKNLLWKAKVRKLKPFNKSFGPCRLRSNEVQSLSMADIRAPTCAPKWFNNIMLLNISKSDTFSSSRG